jgi:hypothetical protein
MEPANQPTSPPAEVYEKTKDVPCTNELSKSYQLTTIFKPSGIESYYPCAMQQQRSSLSLKKPTISLHGGKTL